MCQLLGMNCATPTDATFSFTGFAARGGLTDHHADGFGIGFFEGKAVRSFIDNQPSSSSPVAELVKNYPIKSRHVISHIRKASQGQVKLQNCHPFVREHWGRHWLFAHNGDLLDFAPPLSGWHTPIGDTDSELAFCALLERLGQRFGAQEPDVHALFEAVAEVTADFTHYGIFNFLLSDGRCMLAHSSTRLWYVTREWPFQAVQLVDEDMAVDFADCTTPDDRVTVIATQPLTHNENWTRFETGELMLFVDGALAAKRVVEIPPEVQERNRRNSSVVE